MCNVNIYDVNPVYFITLLQVAMRNEIVIFFGGFMRRQLNQWDGGLASPVRANVRDYLSSLCDMIGGAIFRIIHYIL